VNGNNKGNARCKANRTFRTRKREYMKDKINELQTNRTKILDTLREASMNLRWVTSL
jgi:hypothetical protein